VRCVASRFPGAGHRGRHPQSRHDRSRAPTHRSMSCDKRARGWEMGRPDESPPRLCSSRSRDRRASGSRMAPCCASTMTLITAIPSFQSVAC
jgi:hypothetical protein